MECGTDKERRMADTLACYGRMFDRMDRCAGCDERPWCREAHDPKPLTGPNAGPTGDDAAWEAVEATEQAMAMFDESCEARRLAVCILSEVLRLSDGNPDRIRLFLKRLEGMSLAEIGAIAGKTKQAVHKDLMALERRSPGVGRVLRNRYLASPGGVVLNELLKAAYMVERRRHPDRQLTGEGGVYDRLARRFGLTSGDAVRKRLDRLVDNVQPEDGREPSCG